MNNNEKINQLTDEALNSLDGAGRAAPKPYLLTRINARMQNDKDSSWDIALKFISRPAVALAGIALIIAVNAMVVSYNYTQKATTVTDETYASVDEYSSSATVLNEIENIEQP